MGRRFLLLGTLTILAITTGVVRWLVSSPITKKACDQITIGMSRSQVEGILGGPPHEKDVDEGGSVGTWFGNEGRIYVQFDAKNLVQAKIWLDIPPKKWWAIFLEWSGIHERKPVECCF